MSDAFVEDAGAYALGILSEDERAAFVEHMRTCAQCQQAVAEVEDLPGLLALVPAEGLADPPPSVLAGLVAQVERLERLERDDELALRRTGRRRLAVWVGAAAVVAAVVVGVASGLVSTPWTRPAPVIVSTSVDLVGDPDVPVTASVDLTAVRWGTRIELTCDYVGDPYAQPAEYTLVVSDAEGGREQVATWLAVPNRELTVPAATATRLEAITGVEMLLGNVVVLSAAVPPPPTT